MKVDFNTIEECIVPMEDFVLKWRFTEEKYHKISQQHLEQLKPLNHEAARFVWNYISQSGLHDDVPFKKDFFRTIDKMKISLGNEKDVKKWLYQRGFPFDKPVYLSWQPTEAMLVPWKLFIKYFDSFYYADDLTIIDSSLNWAILFYHEDEIYFGTNENFEPSQTNENIDFIW